VKAWKIWAAVALIVAVEAVAAPKAPKLCAERSTDCGSTLSVGGTVTQKKFSPGHYMLPYAGESQATLLKRADEVCSEPALKGMEMVTRWAALESSKGHFTFGNVEQLYQRLATCKKRLVLEVLAVRFDGHSDGIVPVDLENQLARTDNDYIARLWEPAVMDRFIALYKALGQRFDPEPYFEGVIFTETAVGNVADSYTATAFIAQVTRAVKATRAAWPTSRVIVYDNFISDATTQQAVDFMKMLHAAGVGVGGPDVIPPPYVGTVGERVYRGEIGGTDHRGGMLAAFAVQVPELGGTKGTYTPRELFDHCVYTNRCRYMFWTRNVASGGAEQQWSTGILPFIRANPSL
jgi:hypothetical protein